MLTMQRNIYGLHAPMTTLMERKIVSVVSYSLPSTKHLRVASPVAHPLIQYSPPIYP